MTDTLNPVTCKNGHVSKLYPSGYCAQCNIEAVRASCVCLLEA